MTVQNYVENVLQPKLQGDGGWVEYVSLEKNIKVFVDMPSEEYSTYADNCLKAAAGEYSFAKQMESFCKFLGK